MVPYHFIIDTTEKYRFESLADVDAFKKWLYKDAENQGYSIAAFGYTEKGVKEKGVVIEYYYSVTVKKHFNDEKDPIKNSEIINYYDSEPVEVSDGSDA